MEIVIGQFKYDPEKQVVFGPAEYMKERGNQKLDEILEGNDAGFNAMVAARPEVPIERMVLVALQTDFAGYLGQKQTILLAQGEDVMSEKQKGLIVNVYRRADGVDATNGGISQRAIELTLVGEGSATEIFEVHPSRPAVRLVRREIAGRPYVHAEPIEGKDACKRGWMFGGNFIFVSDSRFTSITGAPIPIHDRQE